MLRARKGYIMLDILLGLLLFSMGFAVIWGLNTSSVFKSAGMDNSLQAINLAASTMDELHCTFQRDRTAIDTYTSLDITAEIGFFDRVIKAEWITKDLLLLNVEVRWLEKGLERKYNLESYFYVSPS